MASADGGSSSHAPLEEVNDQIKNSSQTQDDCSPTIENLLNQKSLRWLFVGGKGGVGKTTSSCAIAVKMAESRTKVLLLSTDPAHNISDAFNQKFSHVPSLVTGFTNLFAMEIDPDIGYASLPDEYLLQQEHDAAIQKGKEMMLQLVKVFPGIDELMSYVEVLKLVRSLDFDLIIFDTAPTGHTLRLLSLPEAAEQALVKVLQLKNSFGGMVNQLSQLMGATNFDISVITDRLEQSLPLVRQISKEFRNPELTTFVCVCIAEFLSLYETERLIQALAQREIDVHNIIVNQLLFAPQDEQPCKMCAVRRRMQNKYLDQMGDLYFDFNVIKTPLMEEEVRGLERLTKFAGYLVTPYNEGVL